MKSCYRKTFTMNGYLTVYLSLMLTPLLSIILGLIGGAMQNLSKLRVEIAADIAMNSVLGEFHRELLEQYDLLFVDISYGTSQGLIDNMEEHAKEYMNKNLHATDREILAWNEPELQQINMTEYVLATDFNGAVMRQQACTYMEESQIEDSFTDLHKSVAAVRELDKVNGMDLWKQVMHQIADMSKSLLPDDNGGRKEAALDNPADEVFHAAEEQLSSLYIRARGSGAIIASDSYLSGRNLHKEKNSTFRGSKENKHFLFQAYLFDKFGTYKQIKQGSLLDCQIEYLIFGETSDQENMVAVTKRLFRWKFADYIRLYFSNDSEYDKAEEIAKSLYAVKRNQELLEPVTQSILYAQAFLDSIRDTDIVLQGGKVLLLEGILDNTASGQDYRQFLWLMLSLESEKSVNLRAMDIMEMDIRQTAHNHNFRMDWCLESYHVQVTAVDWSGNALELNRRYGYY